MCCNAMSFDAQGCKQAAHTKADPLLPKLSTIEQKVTKLLSPAPPKPQERSKNGTDDEDDDDDVQIVEQEDLLIPANVPGQDLRGQVRSGVSFQ
jgi:hypothetical protein